MVEKGSIIHIGITSLEFMPRVWRGALAAKDSGFKVSIIGIGEAVNNRGISCIGFKAARNRFERMFKVSKAMVKRAAESDADIVELHAPELLMYYKLLKKKSKKVLFNSHEFYRLQIETKDYIPSFMRKLISKIYGCIEKKICEHIDGIIYPCKIRGTNPFEDYLCESVKIENYSDGVAIEAGQREERSAIYAGSLSYDRGCTEMVEVFNEIDGILYLAGEFTSDEYKQYIFDIMDPNKVKYLGVLDRDELLEMYSKVSVGLSLLKKVGQYNQIDNLSTKLYEYMMCGIPTVATNMDFAERVNDEYEFAILVNPDNIEEIKSAIEKIFSDKMLAVRLGNNGKRAIKEKYNWKNEKEKLISFYKELCV